MKHAGLRHRRLVAVGGEHALPYYPSTEEDQIESALESSLSGIESDLVALVKKILEPLFVVFEFSRFSDDIYEDIVSRFLKGEVT